jgi:hypothetical protein
MMAKSTDPWVKELADGFEHIAEAVCQDGKEVIVDSSKEITRALFLVRFVQGSRIIHLLRHPAKILESDFHRLKNGTGFKFLRHRFYPKRFFGPFLLMSCLGWIVGNLLVEVVKWFKKDSVLRIRYEDIISSPAHELDRIQKFAEVDLTRVKKKIIQREPFDVGHNVGGNHMRMAGNFIFDPKRSTRSGLPKRYRRMAIIVCWPLLQLYGYKE